MLYAVVVVALLAATLLAVGYRLSSPLVRPPRQPLTRTPDAYGLEYKDIAFLSKEGLQLKGWWIPALPGPNPGEDAPAPVVLLLHPMFGNRCGVWPARAHGPSTNSQGLDLIQLACSFRLAGFAVMLFDFRGHGESQWGPCAGGYNEDRDVAGAVDYAFRRLSREAPGVDPQVGIVGFGLGATAAITAIGRVRGDARTIRVFSADGTGASGIIEFQAENIKRLAFLVAVEPASLQTLLGQQLRPIFPPLSWLLLPIADRFCRFRNGYPLDGRLLLQFAEQVHTPALLVEARPDERHRAREAQQLYEAIPEPKQLWSIDGPDDPLVRYGYVAAHVDLVVAFAREQLGCEVPLWTAR